MANVLRVCSTFYTLDLDQRTIFGHTPTLFMQNSLSVGEKEPQFRRIIELQLCGTGFKSGSGFRWEGSGVAFKGWSFVAPNPFLSHPSVLKLGCQSHQVRDTRPVNILSWQQACLHVRLSGSLGKGRLPRVSRQNSQPPTAL